jgi:plastocyanin
MRPSQALPALAAALLALPGCGDDSDDHVHPDASAIDASTIDADPNQPDGAPAPDAQPSSVVEVACAGATVAVTVTAPGSFYAFAPDDGAPADEYTIAVDDVVRFTMPAIHNAASGPPNAPDGLFLADFNQTTCFQFTEAGTYPFHCVPHDFSATLIVE